MDVNVPRFNLFAVRVSAERMPETIATIQRIWDRYFPDRVFDYSFLDGEFESLYRSEQRMGNVFGVFTFLSIFVACLGLFGLSVYTAERRKKEIGVRKVLGASVQSVVTLLSRDFLKLVLLSAIIAFPIAWIAMTPTPARAN